MFTDLASHVIVSLISIGVGWAGKVLHGWWMNRSKQKQTAAATAELAAAKTPDDIENAAKKIAGNF